MFWLLFVCTSTVPSRFCPTPVVVVVVVVQLGPACSSLFNVRPEPSLVLLEADSPETPAAYDEAEEEAEEDDEDLNVEQSRRHVHLEGVVGKASVVCELCASIPLRLFSFPFWSTVYIPGWSSWRSVFEGRQGRFRCW